MIENAAVFVGRNRRYKGVNVEYVEGEAPYVLITLRATGDEFARYSVVAVAKEGMAWDVVDGASADSPVRRLVAQIGCGCGGMKSYTVDEGYTGGLQ